MKRRRLHWFWRGAIALLLASSYGGVSVTVTESAHTWVCQKVRQPLVSILGLPEFGWANGIAVAVAWFVPIVLLGFGAYGLLTRRYGDRPHDGETRCRKCDYILRGLTEPRCPECGERI